MNQFEKEHLGQAILRDVNILVEALDTGPAVIAAAAVVRLIAALGLLAVEIEEKWPTT